MNCLRGYQHNEYLVCNTGSWSVPNLGSLEDSSVEHLLLNRLVEWTIVGCYDLAIISLSLPEDVEHVASSLCTSRKCTATHIKSS